MSSLYRSQIWIHSINRSSTRWLLMAIFHGVLRHLKWCMFSIREMKCRDTLLIIEVSAHDIAIKQDYLHLRWLIFIHSNQQPRSFNPVFAQVLYFSMLCQNPCYWCTVKPVWNEPLCKAHPVWKDQFQICDNFYHWIPCKMNPSGTTTCQERPLFLHINGGRFRHVWLYCGLWD